VFAHNTGTKKRRKKKNCEEPRDGEENSNTIKSSVHVHMRLSFIYLSYDGAHVHVCLKWQWSACAHKHFGSDCYDGAHVHVSFDC
jgi:hypothetical protein